MLLGSNRSLGRVIEPFSWTHENGCLKLLIVGG